MRELRGKGRGSSSSATVIAKRSSGRWAGLVVLDHVPVKCYAVDDGLARGRSARCLHGENPSALEDSSPRRLVVRRRKRAMLPSSHRLRIVAMRMIPLITKFAVTSAGLRERSLYRAHFADAGMAAPR